MLDMGAHAGLLVRKSVSGLTGADGTQSAKIIHIRSNQSAVTQKTGFQTHLHERDIRIHAFPRAFFPVQGAQTGQLCLIRSGVFFQKKARPVFCRKAPASHNG